VRSRLDKFRSKREESRKSDKRRVLERKVRKRNVPKKKNRKKIEAQAAILKRNSAEVGDLRQLRGDQWGTRAAETARRWGRKNRRGERIDWKISGSVGGKGKIPEREGGESLSYPRFFPPSACAPNSFDYSNPPEGLTR